MTEIGDCCPMRPSRSGLPTSLGVKSNGINETRAFSGKAWIWGP